ncbi:hypothetical protein FPOA_03994 [Fusarium poae]|uniref:Uncharacterized protein n=2 Tax=Fusarium poae TaxID=36050 RepID=A0A1B8ASE2_FUSPO|nr:hypothetical protein FPOA_03994 [Fusarium poae]
MRLYSVNSATSDLSASAPDTRLTMFSHGGSSFDDCHTQTSPTPAATLVHSRGPSYNAGPSFINWVSAGGEDGLCNLHVVPPGNLAMPEPVQRRKDSNNATRAMSEAKP